MNNTDVYKEISTSGLFDTAFYERQYPDVVSLGVDCVEHFVKWGVKIGRRPAPWFDTLFYLRRYPDVARSGLNPFLHYIKYGRREGRIPNEEGQSSSGSPIRLSPHFVETVDMHGVKVALWPPPVYSPGGFAQSEHTDQACAILRNSVERRRTTKRFTIAVHAHVHYLDQMEELAEALSNLPAEFSLYVSVHDEAALAAVEQAVVQQLPGCRLEIRVVPNLGRDIAPMVVEFANDLLRHDLMLHIHTKRSPHNGAKADWRRQLLHGLLGTKGVVQEILDLFAENSHVGMVFPEYHHSLRGQISWGTNFPVCSELAARLRISVTPDELTIFPAGSMFWARPSALRKLLAAGLSYSDFPSENGQVDGTLAHAVERLFGVIVSSEDQHVLQTRVDRPYTLAHYYPKKWPFPEAEAMRAAAVGARYRAFRPVSAAPTRVVVYTAISGGYESLLPQLALNNAYDYVAFCDRPVMDGGCWEVRPMDYWSPDPVRMARYVKTHPHKYFGGYDYAVWIDANVLVRCDISKYVELLAARPEFAIGGIPHPVRRTVRSEAEAVIAAGKDDPMIVKDQMERYRLAGFSDDGGLVETNFMVIALNHSKVNDVLDQWWMEIDAGSRRDQLSLNFALWLYGQGWLPIFSELRSLRSTREFAYFGHGRNSGYPFDLSAHPLGGRLVDPYAAPTRKVSDAPVAGSDGTVDIVICVHNALEDVERCVPSVLANVRSGDSIVIVDDGSEPETAAYLDRMAAENPRVRVLRNHPPAKGYCVAANLGMRSCTADFVLLLNSDAILPLGAIERMLAVMQSNQKCGIVGPLSNAASTQSIPYITGTQRQTAINEIPAGLTLEEMDAACQAWSLSPLHPSVPLVHGFCQLIRRDLIEALGGFDEESFPEGYGEENDLCIRAADSGFDLVVATNVYVFHRKSASYSDDERRERLMRAGSEQLRRKHGSERVSRAIRSMQGHPLLERMRNLATGLVQEL